MSFAILVLGLATCATSAKPVPDPSRPSDIELGRRLRAMHNKCIAYQGLTVYEAYRRAMEEWRALHGTNARVDECVALFASDNSVSRPLPEATEQSPGVPGKENPGLGTPLLRLEELEARIHALRARVLTSKERLVKLREELEAQTRCAEEFNIEEIYFEPWFCSHINAAMSR
ncbi:hypothetical protein HYW17_00425 [Candidatus Uhrbacteria bacterium]|nr:hypothetical protein [Candidatus Uhrbacteria bacterium]